MTQYPCKITSMGITHIKLYSHNLKCSSTNWINMGCNTNLNNEGGGHLFVNKSPSTSLHPLSRGSPWIPAHAFYLSRLLGPTNVQGNCDYWSLYIRSPEYIVYLSIAVICYTKFIKILPAIVLRIHPPSTISEACGIGFLNLLESLGCLLRTLGPSAFLPDSKQNLSTWVLHTCHSGGLCPGACAKRACSKHSYVSNLEAKTEWSK